MRTMDLPGAGPSHPPDPAPGLLPERREMEAALHQRDTEYDGRFIFGVVSTGIYCRPSCPARRPLPKNVRFFSGPPEARAAGLRACRRCRPDRSADADAREIEALLRRLDDDPARYAGVEDLATELGVGTSKLHVSLRRHAHESPGRRLQRARLATASRQLLASEDSVASVAFDAGFESLSAFTDGFRRAFSMTPTAYRGLLGARELELSLPTAYPRAAALAYLGRDPAGTFATAKGDHFAFGLRGSSQAPMAVEGQLRDGVVQCRLVGPGASSPGAAVAAHRELLRWLGLERDPGPFQRFAMQHGLLSPLVASHDVLRLHGPGDAFLALVWTILGQQVTLAFASTLLSRLGALAGEPLGGGLHAPPRPAAVAELDDDVLRRSQLSRAKVSYLKGVAASVANGDLDLEALRGGTATLAREVLLSQRGLGPWSADYLLLRAFGYVDAMPQGDAGLARGLIRFLDLDERPDAREQARLMAPFAPYRGWVTIHLWNLAMEAP